MRQKEESMKKFQYRRVPVLRDKSQVLDDLKVQHAAILQSVNRKQEEINQLNQRLAEYGSDFDKKKSTGASIEDFKMFDICISRMEECIDTEKEKLKELQIKEQKKKEEVIEAKTDTSKFEKLKEKKVEEYNKAAAKEEESFIEEFVIRGLGET